MDDPAEYVAANLDRLERIAESICGGRGYGADIVQNTWLRCRRDRRFIVNSPGWSISPDNFLKMIMRQVWARMNRSFRNSPLQAVQLDPMLEAGFDPADDNKPDRTVAVYNWAARKVGHTGAMVISMPLAGYCDREIADFLGLRPREITPLRESLTSRLRHAINSDESDDSEALDDIAPSNLEAPKQSDGQPS